MTYALFVLLGFASSLLSSVFGFGSAMIVLAVGPYLLPVHQVVALSAILFAASTLTKTFAFRSHIHWPVVGYITVGSFPFAYLGGLLLPHLSQQVLQRCLGFLILAYVVLKIPGVTPVLRRAGHRLGRSTAAAGGTSDPDTSPLAPASPPRKIWLITIAACYGFTSGLAGSGSIIKAIFFRQLTLGKEAFVGTMAATSVVATVGKIVAYTQTGMLHRGLTVPMLALTAAAVCAVFLGRLFLNRINSELFNHGITVLTCAAALGLLL